MKDPELRKIINSFLIPFSLLVLAWLVFIVETYMGLNLHFLGVFPLRAEGLPGIITSPFIHSDLSHLFSNSIPMLVLGAMLFYWYRSVSFPVLLLMWLGTGALVWLIGRPSWHIGASGVTYGLAAFLFTSGVISKNPRLYALSLAVIFLYGSMVWGVFPDFFPKKNISWEAHASGLIMGLILAFAYRAHAPKREAFSWELEEETTDDKVHSDNKTPKPPLKIHYDISPGQGGENQK